MPWIAAADKREIQPGDPRPERLDDWHQRSIAPSAGNRSLLELWPNANVAFYLPY
jgi:hypothetical protein